MKTILTAACVIAIAGSLSAAPPPRTLTDCTDGLCAFVAAWMNVDSSAMTAQLLSTIDTLDNGLLATPQPQQINAAVLQGATPQTLPDANDLVYSTLLGQPYFPNLPADPLRYVVNASGANREHVLPQSGWAGREADQVAYSNYIHTILAVESFNAYVLNRQALDLQNTLPAHRQLLSQAAAPDAAAAVASEDIGPVLRQLLVVERQNLALMSELVQTQKQLVTAQAMTNALLIATSPTESQLLAKAMGAPATQAPRQP